MGISISISATAATFPTSINANAQLRYLTSAMAGKKGTAGEGSKKAQGQARKAETAAQKAAAEDAKKAEVEAAEWSKGSKSNAKK